MRVKMNKRERRDFVRYLSGLSDSDLEAYYYRSVLDSLGSEAEQMYELGYDVDDIQEREVYERELCERVGLIETECLRRSIALWVPSGSEEGK